MLTLTPPGFRHLNYNGTETVRQVEKSVSLSSSYQTLCTLNSYFSLIEKYTCILTSLQLFKGYAIHWINPWNAVVEGLVEL